MKLGQNRRFIREKAAHSADAVSRIFRAPRRKSVHNLDPVFYTIFVRVISHSILVGFGQMRRLRVRGDVPYVIPSLDGQKCLN